VKLSPHDPDYPRSLYRLDEPPKLTVSGPLVGDRVVAIVGSREASDDAQRFAFGLAYHLARANVVVVSGGAVGIDRRAHEGAMHAGGTTWLVSPTGRGVVFPTANRDLVAEIEASATSRVIWPFEDGRPKDQHTPRFRNGVLVALAECVVVVQAALKSGSRNAAAWGRRLGRPVFVVPGAPWMDPFKGSVAEGARGALPLWSYESFFEKLGLPAPDTKDHNAAWSGIMPPSAAVPRRRARPQTYSDPPLFKVDPTTWSDDERHVFSIISIAPTQQDMIIAQSGLPTSSTLTALLTLSLKDVVVEGPDGFFRRRAAL
jgi:DNA processing protein